MLKKCLSRFKKWVVSFLLLGIGIQLLNSINIVLFQRIIDQLSVPQPYQYILKDAMVYGMILTVVCVLNYINEYPSTYLTNGIIEQLKLFSFEKISRIDYASYQQIGTGEIIKIIENGAAAGQSIIFSFYLRIFAELLPTIVFSLIFISFFDIKLMAIIAVGYVVIFIITNLLLKSLYRIKNNILEKQEHSSKYSVRGFMELVVFRVNKQYKKELDKLRSIAKEIVGQNCKITMIHEAFFFIFAIMITVIKIIILISGISNILTGNTTVGILVALLSFVDKIYNPIAIFNVLYVDYKLNKVTYDRLQKFLELPEDMNLYHGRLVEQIVGNIQLKDVQFYYGDVPILKDISINIPAGTSIALVGESGGGKSTIIKLLTGLLKKKDGSLLVDGVDIDDINLNSFYDHISYISQDPPIFDASIRENIIFDTCISDEEINHVLTLVNLKNKVDSLPKGLNTIVGERGVLLSGGERQRLAVARAIIQNRQVLIMDEPVSALDTINEEMIMKQIGLFFKEKVVIIVAHHLQYVQNFDQIMVLRKGEIVAIGTFDELTQSCAYFREIWDKDQRRKEE